VTSRVKDFDVKDEDEEPVPMMEGGGPIELLAKGEGRGRGSGSELEVEGAEEARLEVVSGFGLGFTRGIKISARLALSGVSLSLGRLTPLPFDGAAFVGGFLWTRIDGKVTMSGATSSGTTSSFS
jgi:hypothetical protein